MRILLPLFVLGVASSLGCDDPQRLGLGETCSGDAECASGLCLEVHCVDPNGDEDHDGIPNRLEAKSGGTSDVPDAGGTTRDAGVGSATGPSSADAGTAVPPPDVSPGARRSYDITFSPNIDMSPCRAGLMWASQNVQVDEGGHFDEIWSVNDPNTAQVSGQVDAGHFSLKLQCLSSGAATALEADRQGAVYTGTFGFGGSNGSFEVRPPDGF